MVPRHAVCYMCAEDALENKNIRLLITTTTSNGKISRVNFNSSIDVSIKFTYKHCLCLLLITKRFLIVKKIFMKQQHYPYLNKLYLKLTIQTSTVIKILYLFIKYYHLIINSYRVNSDQAYNARNRIHNYFINFLVSYCV